VTFTGYDGTKLRIPATSSNQTINFTDLTTNNILRISSGQILFGATEVTTEKKYYPGLDVGLNVILSAGTPDHTAASNRYTCIYGTSGVNNITLNTGSKVKLVNAPGENNITFPANVADIVSSRSGTIVTIRDDSNGTVLLLPASSEEQNITFNDTTTTVQVVGGIIFLNANPVSLSWAGGYPDGPSSDSVYNFDTRLLSGHNNQWYQEIPDGEGELWMTTATATANASDSTDTILAAEWSQPKQVSPEGRTAYRTVILILYQRAATQPDTDDIADPVIYTHTNGLLSGSNRRELKNSGSPAQQRPATSTGMKSGNQSGRSRRFWCRMEHPARAWSKVFVF